MKTMLRLTLVVSTITSSLAAHYLPFVDKDFNDFCNRMVPQAQRAHFTDYYRDLVKKIEGLQKEAQLQERHNLYAAALNNLKKDHKVWADDITEFLANLAFLDTAYDQDRHEIQLFLERYGAYKAFEIKSGISVAHTAPSTENNFDVWWQQFKSQCSKTVERIGSWFKAGHSSTSV